MLSDGMNAVRQRRKLESSKLDQILASTTAFVILLGAIYDLFVKDKSFLRRLFCRRSDPIVDERKTPPPTPDQKLYLLPEEWKKLSKGRLLDLCEQHGLVVSAKKNKDYVIDLLMKENIEVREGNMLIEDVTRIARRHYKREISSRSWDDCLDGFRNLPRESSSNNDLV
uniref:Uncharacterized protein n=1 Tax=Aplanochytrium stocchinoi TaxID=215587 RepID=A0A7S3LP77_9STRA